MTSPALKYNTMVAKQSAGSNTMSYAIHGQYTGTTTTGGANTGNYFDLSGATGAYYPNTMTPTQNWTSSGNINMKTGATITP
jgi:hypothetical protein